MHHRDRLNIPELHQPLLGDLDQDILNPPRKINAYVHIWIRKFFWGDYLLPWRWFNGLLKALKQGHVAIELPPEISRALPLEWDSRYEKHKASDEIPFYLSYYSNWYMTKAKDFKIYPSDTYNLKIYPTPIEYHKAIHHLKKILANPKDGEKLIALKTKGADSNFNHYYPGCNSNFFLCGNMLAAFFSKTYNCTSFAVDFLQCCGADIPIYPRHLGAVLFNNTLIGAMAGFNAISSYDLLMHSKKELVEAETSEVIGAISLVLLIIQGGISFISIFVIPNIKNTEPVNKISRQVDKTMVGNNSEANTSTLFLLAHGILLGLNLFFEKDYGDNALGLVAGSGSALLLSMAFHLIAINLFGAIFDDTNFITRPVGLRIKIKNYLWANNNEQDKSFSIDGYEKYHEKNALYTAV